MSLLEALKSETNLTYTENGGTAHKTSLSKVLDMFAVGAAFRSRSDQDVIALFSDALEEDESLALKCLFYIRDIRGGQGERRFFRVCMNWLAKKHPRAALRVMDKIPEYGRWDDMYCLVGTSLQNEAFDYMRNQLSADMANPAPSLLAKWLKSENTSSKESRDLARLTRCYFDMTPRQYRKTLTALREKINLVETRMSKNEWNKIQYDAIPSKAGLKYRAAFERHDEERYKAFMQNQYTKVNADTLYPYEVVYKAIQIAYADAASAQRAAVNKYWDNLTDYFKGASLNALCMVDTSGSMIGTPINVAISLGLYCAEKAQGPFKNHYISFASCPQLIEIKGYDFVEKVRRIYDTNLCDNTNIEAAFDMVLDTAIKHHMKQKDLPENIIIVSDMEFDMAANYEPAETTMDTITAKWTAAGYEAPHLIYWNVDARQTLIPSVKGNVSYVSGFSPVLFENVMTGKTGYDLMLDKLMGERYACIK